MQHRLDSWPWLSFILWRRRHHLITVLSHGGWEVVKVVIIQTLYKQLQFLKRFQLNAISVDGLALCNLSLQVLSPESPRSKVADSPTSHFRQASEIHCLCLMCFIRFHTMSVQNIPRMVLKRICMRSLCLSPWQFYYDCNCRERVDCLVHVTGEFRSVDQVSNRQAPHSQMSLNSS